MDNKNVPDQLLRVAIILIWVSAGWSFLALAYSWATTLSSSAGTDGIDSRVLLGTASVMLVHGLAVTIARPAVAGVAPVSALLMCASAAVTQLGVVGLYNVLLYPSSILLALSSFLPLAYPISELSDTGRYRQARFGVLWLIAGFCLWGYCFWSPSDRTPSPERTGTATKGLKP